MYLFYISDMVREEKIFMYSFTPFFLQNSLLSPFHNAEKLLGRIIKQRRSKSYSRENSSVPEERVVSRFGHKRRKRTDGSSPVPVRNPGGGSFLSQRHLHLDEKQAVEVGQVGESVRDAGKRHRSVLWTKTRACVEAGDGLVARQAVIVLKQ